MRTTLTVDDDVAVELTEIVRRDGRPLKAVVNDALRRGLLDMRSPANAAQKPFKTRTFDSVPLLASYDNIAEVLAYAEGEDFK